MEKVEDRLTRVGKAKMVDRCNKVASSLASKVSKVHLFLSVLGMQHVFFCHRVSTF